MGSAFFQTTLFWVFTLDYWLKSDYLPTPNNHNYLINSMPISQTFVLKKRVHFFLLLKSKVKICLLFDSKFGERTKNMSFSCLFCDCKFRKNNLRRHVKGIHKVKMNLFLHSQSREKLNWKHTFKWFMKWKYIFSVFVLWVYI